MEMEVVDEDEDEDDFEDEDEEDDDNNNDFMEPVLQVHASFFFLFVAHHFFLHDIHIMLTCCFSLVLLL